MNWGSSNYYVDKGMLSWFNIPEPLTALVFSQTVLLHERMLGYFLPKKISIKI